MNIDKYRTADGDYIDEKGRHWNTAMEFLQGDLLGFCCCGCPYENVKYIGSILRHIENLRKLVWEKKITYEEWEEQGNQIGTTDALYFAYYFLDSIDFIEHGGSVPGWLTPAGVEFMEDAISIEEEL